MITLILAIIFAVAGFAVTVGINAYREKESGDEGYTKIIFPRYIGLAFAVLFIVLSCITVVPTGYTGVLTTFGPVEEKTIGAGANIIAPWQKVIKMDNRTQKIGIETSAFSSDIQQVNLVLSLNYRIDQATAQELYRTVGANYYELIVYPRILENTKAVFSQYTAENLISKRDTLSDQIVNVTSEDLQDYGIKVVGIAIEDIDFTDAFTNAVEAKQVAAQNKLTAETEQAQKTMEEEEAAKRAIIQAKAEAEKAIIAADAEFYAGEKEAEKNKHLSESLTGNVVDYYWMKRWDGKLPTTVLGSDSNYMVDLH